MKQGVQDMAKLNTDTLNVGDIILAANLFNQEVRRLLNAVSRSEPGERRHVQSLLEDRTETRDKLVAIMNDWDEQIKKEHNI